MPEYCTNALRHVALAQLGVPFTDGCSLDFRMLLDEETERRARESDASF